MDISNMLKCYDCLENNKDSEAKAYLIQTINPIFIFATPEYKKIIYDQSKRYGLPK